MDETESHDTPAVSDAELDAVDEWSKTGRLVRRISGEKVIDLSDAVALCESVPPHQKTLIMVILLTIRDMATQLAFEPCHTEADGPSMRMIYEVEGQWYDLVPPPPHLTMTITRELKEISRPIAFRQRFAILLRRVASRLDPQSQFVSRSTIQIRLPEESLVMSSTTYSSPLGDRVFLAFPDRSASMSQKAKSALMAIFEATKSEEERSEGISEAEG